MISWRRGIWVWLATLAILAIFGGLGSPAPAHSDACVHRGAGHYDSHGGAEDDRWHLSHGQPLTCHDSDAADEGRHRDEHDEPGEPAGHHHDEHHDEHDHQHAPSEHHDDEHLHLPGHHGHEHGHGL